MGHSGSRGSAAFNSSYGTGSSGGAASSYLSSSLSTPNVSPVWCYIQKPSQLARKYTSVAPALCQVPTMKSSRDEIERPASRTGGIGRYTPSTNMSGYSSRPTSGYGMPSSSGYGLGPSSSGYPAPFSGGPHKYGSQRRQTDAIGSFSQRQAGGVYGGSGGGGVGGVGGGIP